MGPAHLNATFWLCLLWGIGLYVITNLLVGPAAGYLSDLMLAVLVPVVGMRLGYGLWALVLSQLIGAVVVCVVSWLPSPSPGAPAGGSAARRSATCHISGALPRAAA